MTIDFLQGVKINCLGGKKNVDLVVFTTLIATVKGIVQVAVAGSTLVAYSGWLPNHL